MCIFKLEALNLLNGYTAHRDILFSILFVYMCAVAINYAVYETKHLARVNFIALH